jgi:hypothetical protein
LVLWGTGTDFQFRLVDASGRVIASQPPGSGLRSASLTANRDIALVSLFRNDPHAQELVAIDPASGATRWRAGTGARSLTLAAGRAYAVEPLPDPLFPTALAVVDLGTGRTDRTATSFVSGIRGDLWVTLLGVADGRLLVHYEAGAGATRVAHVTAYRTIPVDPSTGYAGGARPQDWPDACGLLSVADLARSIPGVRYTPYPRALAMFPHATSCDYQPSPISAPAVSVAVRWVGADVAQAASLLADPDAWEGGAVVTVDGEDESIAVKPGYPPDNVEVILRVGRRIVSVSATGPVAQARALARTVAAHLHALPA